ncbi:MAG: hypothetical protein E7628_02605 [Ruminococcaceae bacterium]|nr:hypothetical protein [Oscillospiraceae bacterium]
MKKIIALVLVLCMSFSMILTVSAATANTFNHKFNLVRLIRGMFDRTRVEDEVVGDNGDNVFDLYIDGISIDEYDIVYPAEADLLHYSTALAFADYLANLGITVDVKSDADAATEYEILIGDTNRKISIDDTVVLGENEYIICQDGKKVVMLGSSFMIAGGVYAFVNEYMVPADGELDVNITNLPEEAEISTYVWETPTSVIYMIGDGMGMKHIEATKELRAEQMPVFFAETFPYFSRVKTFSYSVDPLREEEYTDSAAAGTALATGYKTINSYLGLDHELNEVKNLRELAYEKGVKTAVLTTDHITGATPSAFLVHHNDRNDGEIIQDAIDALMSEGLVEYCYGTSDDEYGDGLTNEAREALSIISKDDSRFFIMIEEAYIDKESHARDMEDMPDKVVRFNECIAYCSVFAVIRGDVFVIVTADHETGGVSKSMEGWYMPRGTHTNTSVPLFCLGFEGLADLATGKTIDNTNIAKFIAKTLYGVEDFGDVNFGKEVDE